MKNACSVNKPIYNHIDVKVTYACNFACEYCYQSDDNGVRQKGVLTYENMNNLLKFIDRMELDYDVTLAGGEPFVYPYLIELAKGLSDRGCKIMIITNFSAPIDKIESFLSVCGKNLKEFNISIHLSQWENINSFYEKLEQFINIMSNMRLQAFVGISCVVTEDNYESVVKLKMDMEQRFAGHSVKLHRVYYNGVYHVYRNDIENYLREQSVDVPIERVSETSYYGKLCWAGHRFFYIEADGTIYRCYTRQENRDKWILGDLSEYEKIEIIDLPTPCLTVDYGRCICYEHFENVKIIVN